MDDSERMKLEALIKELESYRGRHTELITVYVSAGSNLILTAKQLENEKSTAVNIKSKSTRKNVMDALERITRHLKLYKGNPPHGLAIFCGNISKIEGQPQIELWTIEPPLDLRAKFYRCDQTFVMEPLKDMIKAKDVFGLIVIDRNEATIGMLEGKTIRVIRHQTSGIPGKFKAGGQSAGRFERGIEGLAKQFYKRVAEAAKEAFFDNPKLKGILIGGPVPTKEKFVKEGDLPTALKDKIIGLRDLGDSTESGLHDLVELSKDLLEEQAITQEKEILKKFFTMLAKNPEKVSYGFDETKHAIEIGAVEEVILSTDLEKDKTDEIEELAKTTSAIIKYVSVETEEGIQFKNIGGIGAILRFQIE
jgi:peptide chain release factor subunit 1